MHMTNEQAAALPSFVGVPVSDEPLDVMRGRCNEAVECIRRNMQAREQRQNKRLLDYILNEEGARHDES